MMRDLAGAQGPDKATSDLWKHTLSQIHTRFGRMVYLTSLRDGNTGAYQHHGLALAVGPERSARTLEQSHLECFREWLELSLAEQHGDLKEYFAEQEAGVEVIVAAWSRIGSYRNLIPAGAAGVERDLYLSDVRALLAVLRNEYGVEVPDPTG